jgi:hypothetical protein
MDKIKVLNDLKALEMKKQHIETLLRNEFRGAYQLDTSITIGGKSIKVDVKSLKEFLINQVDNTKIEYDAALKSLINNGGL